MTHSISLSLSIDLDSGLATGVITGGGSGTIALSASQDTDGDAQGTAIGTLSGGTGPYTVTDATNTTQVASGNLLQVGSVSPSVGSVTITIHDTGIPAAADANFTIGTVPKTPSVALVSTDDSGASNSDNITNINTPHIDITCPTTPLVGDVITGKDGATVIFTHTLVSGDITGSIAELGLSALADGVHSLTAQHSRGSLNSAFSSALSLTIDTTAPTLSSAVGVQDGTTSSQADLSFSTNEGTGTAYWVISTSGTPPSVAQIQAGQDSTGSAALKSGSQAVSATGAQTATASGLSNGTYFLYAQQKDVAGNNSTVAASSSWVQTVTSGPVLTYGGAQTASLGTYSSPLFTSVPIGANTVGANRRVLVCIQAGASFIKTGSLLTDVKINGTSVLATAILVNGSGGSSASFSGLIIWAYADIGDASTSCTVDVTASGTNMNGSSSWSCSAYTFDKSLLSQSAPIHAEVNVADSAAVSTVTNAGLTTHANGFVIAALNLDILKSPAPTGYALTTATDTLTTDHNGTKFVISSKTANATAQAGYSATWAWTNNSQAFTSVLEWY